MGRRLSEPTDELGKDATAKATRWSWTGQGCHGLRWDMKTVQHVGTLGCAPWWDGCAFAGKFDMMCMPFVARTPCRIDFANERRLGADATHHPSWKRR